MAGHLDRHSDSYGCLALFAGVLVLGLVILAVVWFVSTVGHVLELTPTYPEIDKHGHAWIDARYENVTAELGRPRPRARRAVVLATALVVLVAAIALAPVGAR